RWAPQVEACGAPSPDPQAMGARADQRPARGRGRRAARERAAHAASAGAQGDRTATTPARRARAWAIDTGARALERGHDSQGAPSGLSQRDGRVAKGAPL